MRLKLWGTRGSIASAGEGTVRYGGDTSCVEITTSTERTLILDAGSGIRRLGSKLKGSERVDVLLSHLHMDHIQGLPFFAPLLDPQTEVHIWGPVSTMQGLRSRLSRYLSPPLFPVHVRDFPNVEFHDVPPGRFELDPVVIVAELVLHPGATLGYRLEADNSVVAYIPDHEPALGNSDLPDHAEWTSGFQLAAGSDVLIHDAQYTDEEYSRRIGWGHTSTSQLALFAEAANASRLVTFHHDPAHTDDEVDEQSTQLASSLKKVELIAGVHELDVEV